MNNTLRFLCLLLCVIQGCKSNDNKEKIAEAEHANLEPLNQEFNDSEIQESDTLADEYYLKLLTDYQVLSLPASAEITTISKSAIVYIGVSSTQIDKLKEEYGEEDFYVVADDLNWYTYQYDQMLDSLDYEVISAKTRYLRFIWGNQSMVIDTEKQGKRSCLCWDYVLFNLLEAPILVNDIVDLNRDAVVNFMEKGVSSSIFNEDPQLWKNPNIRIEQLLRQLRPNDEISDRAFANFLIEYVEIIEQLNKILFNSTDYEIYNSLPYQDEKLHEPIAKEFEIKLKELGLGWSTAEGNIFIERNTDYLASKFSKHWSPTMTEFMHMYSIENERAYAEDGGFSIPLNELVDRLVYWENFNRKYPTFVLNEYSVGNERSYTYFILNGMDNTPAFGYDEGNKLDPIFKNGYNYALQKYPDSNLSTILKVYLKLLNDSGFVRDKSVKVFLKKYNIY